MKNIFWGLFATLTLFACSAAHNTGSNKSAFKILNRIKLPGDGFWDYITVDETTDRLYVSHGTQVQVVDLKTDQPIGAIPNQKGVHGIALAPEFGKGFISNGGDTSVTVFDLKSLAASSKIKVTGANPDAILYDPFSKRLFSFNHNGNNATAIDAATNKVIGTITLSGSPEFAVTDGKGLVFVNIEDKSEMAVIDVKTLTVKQKWSLAPGEEPTGLAFDAKNGRLFSVCGNKKMVVSDAKTGKILQTLPIGDGADGVAFDPISRQVFSSNGEGNVTIVGEKSADKYQVIATVPSQKGARTIGVNSKTHRIYMPTAEREAAVGNARPAVKPGTFVVLEMGEQ
ncbi:MAG: YncE family protein [Bacteroidota bacterium]